MPQFAEFEPARAWLARHRGCATSTCCCPTRWHPPRQARHVDELESVHRNGMLLPASMFALDVLGGTCRHRLGFDEGDAMPLPAAAGSLAPVPWLGEPVAQMQVAMYEHDRSPFFGDPRQCSSRCWDASRPPGSRRDGRGTRVLLRRPRAHRAGLCAAARSRSRDVASTRPRSTRWPSSTSTRGARAIDERPGAGAAAAPCSRSTSGQFEVNLHHVDDALLAATTRSAQAAREGRGTRAWHGCTFMPKPYRDHAGSGTHLHVSLLDRTGATSSRRGSRGLAGAAPRHRRPRGDHRRHHGGVRPHREFLPPLPARAYVPLTPSWS